MRRAKAIMICGTIMSMFAPGLAAAQDVAADQKDDAVNSDEIIVTAQKRSQDLQDVPISISVVTGKALEKQGIVKLEDLGTTVPNFTVSANAISDAITIRGINSNSTSGSDQAVGLYVDGIYRGRGAQSRFAFLDLAQVEVLRGPQGTLFGKNTLAGAVNITSAKPSSTFGAAVQALYEFNADETDIRGHITGPLTDTLSARIGFMINRMDKGYIYNTAKDEFGPKKRDWAARGSLAWEPTDTVHVALRYEHGHARQKGTPIEIIVAGNLPAITAAFDLPSPSTKLGPVTAITSSVNPFPGPVPPQTQGPTFYQLTNTDEVSGQLDVDVGSGTLTTIAAYSYYNFNRDQDADFGPLPLAQAQDGERYKQRSIEVRYASDDSRPFYFLLGGFYQKENLTSYLGSAFNTTFLDGLTCAGAGQPQGCSPFSTFGSGIYNSREFAQSANTIAVFMQATYKPIDNLFLTGGVRYGRNRKRATQVVSAYDAETGEIFTTPTQLAVLKAVLGIEPHVLTGRLSDGAWLPQASVRWEFMPNFNIYASYAKGRQDGGFNAWQLSNVVSDYAYRPTSSEDYEIGFKAQSPTRTWAINVNYFNNRFDDLQALSYSGASGFIVNNAAAARVQGVEFDGSLRPFSGFTLSAAGAFTKFKFLSFANAGCTAQQILQYGGDPGACASNNGNDLKGRTSTHAPKFTLTSNAEYVIPIGDNELSLMGQVEHSSAFYASTDLDVNVRQKAFTKLNATVAFGPSDKRWEVALVGRNLTNKYTFSFGDDTPLSAGTYDAALDRPRTIAVRASAQF